jgi:hypothetical protein
VALALAVPLIVAANPVDPTWLPGFYDDADTDQLVTQTMSPEAWIGLTVLVIVCFLSSSTIAGLTTHGRRRVVRGWPGARPPPSVVGTSMRGSVFGLRRLQCVRLAHLCVRQSRSCLKYSRRSASGGAESLPDEKGAALWTWGRSDGALSCGTRKLHE